MTQSSAQVFSRTQELTHLSRRSVLTSLGMGVTGMMLGVLEEEQRQRTWAAFPDRPSRLPHHTPRVKSVIWLFMVGGVSHLESFDPKPVLNQYAGEEIGNTPYREFIESPLIRENLRIVVPNDANGHIRSKLFPLQVGYRRWGESGLEISDWWPHVAHHADKLAIVRSMWTTDNNHGAQLQFHTGRHTLDGVFPTIGSWIHYGLGSLNDNLPQFVVLGEPLADCCGGSHGHGSQYLGPEHAGIRLKVDPRDPLPFARPATVLPSAEAQARQRLWRSLSDLALAEFPEDTALQARIRAYELAFRMQMAVPELMDFSQETKETQELYGLERPTTRNFGQLCLAARRLVERGVRFVQVFHGSNGGAGAWDAHSDLKQNHARLCEQVDQPIGALLHDLERRGLLDETLVVWGTEFGRTPGAQGTGRDHHPFGFSVWLAGGGIRGGVAHGATDPLGFHAVEDRHYITDLHATVLHLLGLHPHRLEIPGRKRLEIEFGHVMEAILS
ncbi:MAG: sulfatase [Planctomycetaceae bacterium]|nr:MAG: sulfatase [Planctomycetaceae bacterium]